MGVKIGASGISAARVVRNGSKLELLDLVREPLQRGVVRRRGSRRSRYGFGASSPVQYPPPAEESSQARYLQQPNRRSHHRGVGRDGRQATRERDSLPGAGVLPIALEDAVLDYQQLSESVNADGELIRRILLVVAYRDLIDRYVVAFKEAGVRLIGIDLEAFGLLRALIPAQTEGRSDAAHVVVSIGHERSTFAVSDGHICEFTRVLEMGRFDARRRYRSPAEPRPVRGRAESSTRLRLTAPSTHFCLA